MVNDLLQLQNKSNQKFCEQAHMVRLPQQAHMLEPLCAKLLQLLPFTNA